MAGCSGGIPMATTLVSCALRYDRALVAHVGDSRCYLVRRGEALVLTRDHTLVGEQMRLGLLSAREAADSPHRHLLSRSLGAEMFVNVETNEYQILGDDVLVHGGPAMKAKPALLQVRNQFFLRWGHLIGT